MNDKILSYEELEQKYLQLIKENEELKQRNAILSINNEKFQSINKNSTNIILIIDIHGKILYYNDAFVKFFGRDSILDENFPFFDFIHNDDSKLVLNSFEKVINEPNSIITFEARAFSIDKEVKWLEVIAQNLIDNPSINGILINAIDITYIKTTELVLSKRIKLIELSDKLSLNSFLTKILNEVEELTNSKISFFHFIEDDEKFVSLQAWSDNTLKHFCNADIIEYHYPIEKAGVWADALRQRKPVIYNNYNSLEYKNGLPQGHSVLKNILVIPVLRNSKILAILGIGNKDTNYNERDIEISTLYADLAWDLAEKKIKEKQLESERALFSEGPVVSIIWSNKENWPVTYVSRNLELVTGYKPEEFLSSNLKYADIIHPDDLQRIADEVNYNINNNINHYEQSYRLKFKDGSFRWIYDFTMLNRDENNKVISILGYIFDQSHQKEIELALEEERTKLTYIIEGTNAGTWEWNVQTGEVKFNQRWAEIIGFTLEELEPISINTWINFAHPEDLAKSQILLDEHFKGNTNIYVCECRMKHKNGNWIWVIDKGKLASWTEDGKPLMMFGTHQEITDRKELELEFLTLIETTTDGFFIANLEGKFLKVNKRFCEMLGYSEDELLNMSIADIEALEKPEEVQSHINKIKNDKFDRFITKHITKNKKILDIEISVSLLEYGHNFLLVFVRDITEQVRVQETLKESEEKYRVMFEESPDAYLIIKNNKFMDCNKAAADMLLTTVENLRNTFPHELSPEYQPNGKLSIDYSYELIARCYKEVSVSFEWVHKKFDGTNFWVEVYLHLMKLDNEEVLFTTWRDITLRKQYEEELIKEKEKAQESNRLKSAFLANMSHEIRTPMNGILGFLQLLRDMELSVEEKKSFIDIIYKSGNRLLDTINDIIEISKIEAKQVIINKSKFVVTDVFDYMISFFTPQANEKNIELILNNKLNKDETFIIADKNKFEGILINLIKNAIKFTQKGVIELGSYLKDDYLLCYVKDSGIGIPKEKLESIFERFVQADTQESKPYEGSGLGLSIVKAYVEMLEGKIWVESEVNSGSTFYFTIKYYKA